MDAYYTLTKLTANIEDKAISVADSRQYFVDKILLCWDAVV